MTTSFVALNNGLDWGSFADTSALPNVTNSPTQNSDLQLGARAYSIADSAEYVCTNPTLDAAAWSANAGGTASTTAYTPADSGDWPGADPTTVAGALDTLANSNARCLAGGWSVVTSASQTDSPLTYGGGGGLFAVRAGSITGLAIYLSGAPTVANIEVSVSKNGATVAATTLTVAPAGDTTQQITLDIGVSTYAAGDVLGVNYTSGGIGNTPTIYATIETSI